MIYIKQKNASVILIDENEKFVSINPDENLFEEVSVLPEKFDKLIYVAVTE